MQLDHEQLQQAIIGSLLLWPAEIDSVSAMLKVEDFHQEKYRMVYDYLLKRDGGDFVTVVNALGKKVKAHELTEWMDSQVTSAFLPRYCQELKEISNKIRIIDFADTVKNKFGSSTSSEMIDMFESLTAKLAVSAGTEPAKPREMIKSAMNALEFRYKNKGKIHGLPYGFDNLDRLTNGMHKGELIVVAGRPSMGKSAFAGNILENACLAGFSAMFFSLEMDKNNVIDRMFASRGMMDYGNIRSGNIEQTDFYRMQKAAASVSEFKMLVDDTPAISIREIRSKARKQKRDGLDLVIIDYLQLMTIPRGESRTLAVGEVSRGLKQLARELEIPVVLLSQLNRGVDSRPDKRPVMSDLRDSGEIEQDADVILFPFRPAAYCQKCKDKVNDAEHSLLEHQSKAEIIIEKQRNGERNVSVPVVWMGKHQKFVSMVVTD